MSAAATTTVLPLRLRSNGFPIDDHTRHIDGTNKKTDDGGGGGWRNKASFMTWTSRDIVYVIRHHWIPCLFAAGLFFIVCVESTTKMISPSSPPFDLGFVATRSLHRVLASSPDLNNVLAVLNSVLGVMQMTYIVAWSWLKEGRPRATISALFLFTCRGILGYSTQLPLPQDYLGSVADFPLGNISFFFFYSGHVAGTTIASLDMRKMNRLKLAMVFDILNVLQAIRLLATRGHYTIDLVVGVGAAIFFYSLAGKYEKFIRRRQVDILDTKRSLVPPGRDEKELLLFSEIV